ncbi:uncharacterized protein LOC124689608 [Lolium rigidum]|uniref:uncharacterized protein LOC124689608 n=1 Tax=Lolium rigidum TaxID=89674 RepID=UPI001F5C67C4|nr:uncharacterized protein LOC124689608 [Lolium rigidum]
MTPDLTDDIVDEILLRLPPEDPGCLFRACLVCKRWRGVLTGTAFASRYRHFHRAPPLLGFLENQFLGCWFAAPSSATSPVPPIHPAHRSLDALDARHGLVLLDVNDPGLGLAVWDPLRRRQWDLPFPSLPGSALGFHVHTYTAAVLCAADGCDNLDCRHTHGHGPFLVACVCDDEKGTFYASMYSSEASAWSPVTSAEHPPAATSTSLNTKPKLLLTNALYFTCHCEPTTVMILRYDVASHGLSIFDGPAASQANHNQYVLVEAGDGALGFASVQGSMLCLWSTEASADGRAVTWARQRGVELDKLLPPLAFSAELYVTGFAEGVGVIVLTYAGTFTIQLKSGRVKNVPGAARILHAFPYTSFYTPDQAGGIMPYLPMSSLENSEAAQDLLLQQASMEASEVRERGKEEGEWKEDDDDDDEEEGEWKEDDGDEEEGEWTEDGDDEEEGGWAEDDDDEESGEELEKDLEHAHNLFGMWSKAIDIGDFDCAVLLAVSTLQCRFSCHGRLSPKCAYTYYIYGCTLLYKPLPDSKPSWGRDDVENVMPLSDNLDFDLALKMLHIARTILEKCPGSSMEKVKVFSALADVKIMSALGRGSLGREDIDYSLRVCFKALAISEHLIEPDNYWIIKLNVSICLIFELASNIGDAVAYCAKAISVCKSRVSNLKNGKEALLLDNGDNASAAEAASERSALSYELEYLTDMSCKLEKKLEHLEQAIPTPASEASGEQNVGDATPRAASSTPVSDLLQLLSTFDPVLRKTSCTPIWPELQNV